jgi:hypothetical protein
VLLLIRVSFKELAYIQRGVFYFFYLNLGVENLEVSLKALNRYKRCIFENTWRERGKFGIVVNSSS